MAFDLKMPALSPTMEKGTLAKWLVEPGDNVTAGDVLAEIETDKATMELEAVDVGRVVRLVVAAGTDDVPVGTVIAVFAALDEVTAEHNDSTSTSPGLQEAAPTALAPSSSPTPPPADDDPADKPRRRVPPADRIRISPLVQRIAKAMNINLDGIVGTGPNGRIVRADLGLVASAVSQPLAAWSDVHEEPTPRTSPASIAAPTDIPVEAVKLSSMRKSIARRLTEAKRTVPHFYLTARCNLDALLKLRGELNVGLAGKDIKLSVNDWLIKALALALHEVPDANVQFGGDVLYRFARADIAMAVALDGGLITPVIRDAGSLSLSSIAKETRVLAAKARDGKLMPEEYQGGTASISNLGMFGIDTIVPVINPPHALILGVGAGIEQPWKVNSGIGLATMMAVTGSFDHRAIDGAVGAQFMSAFREMIETPLLIVG
jgi:pyruvate dehydrogenase E2 component (dihydrolipoamide acetyltransferase)